MCGITGAVWSDSRLAVTSETLERMADSLRHRGPDDRHTHLESARDGEGRETCVALGFRRLSIIDLEGARQPMTNEDGERLHGQIVEIHDDVVIMNFNHPLAGKEMHFSGKILSVRAATREEIDHGHVHGVGGVHHH